MAKMPDLQVVIPYKRLLELLEASEAVPQLRSDLEWKDQQIKALRGQFSELMQAFADLKREVQSL